MRRTLALGLLCGALGLTGCGKKTAGLKPGPPIGPDASPAAAEPSRDRVLFVAELQRDPSAVRNGDLASRDVRVRRAAARTLARTALPEHVALLTTALADEDPEVVAWTAYGLGQLCRADGIVADDVVRVLVVRAARAPQAGQGKLSPTTAIARALGRCATDTAERSLATWLDGDAERARAAAFALGDIAGRRKALSQPTELALLAAAAGGAAVQPVGEGLYPFGRLDHALTEVQARLLEVARARLADTGTSRAFAVRALGRVPKGGDVELERVLATASTFDTIERAEAARGLERLGPLGVRALGRSLGTLVPARDPLSMTALGTPLFGPLLATVELIAHGASFSPDAAMRRSLFALAHLSVPPDAPAPLVRRITRLRCAAAVALVNAAHDDPLLLACDGEADGETGQLAQLSVIGRRLITLRRLAAYKRLAASPHLRVREAAVSLLAAHPEVDATSALVQALAAEQPGLVATAADFVAQHPERASGQVQIADALLRALERPWPPDAIKTLGSLLEATGAVRLGQAEKQLDASCSNANATVREYAARGLSLLRRSKVSCKTGPVGRPLEEAARLVSRPVVLDLATDTGSLRITLDPALAPLAVTRLFELARDGFFDGMAVHRVVPGFVVQLGDRGGDGYGGSGRPPLPCEAAPVSVEPLDVVVALAGKDTGSSQIFVALGRQPQLYGEAAVVGKAEGDWASVAEGDVIMHVGILNP